MSRLRRIPFAQVIVVVSLLVVVVAIVGYVRAGSHQVLPGVRGCKLIRDVHAQTGCIVDQLQAAMDGRSVKTGLLQVERLARRDPLVQSQCHLAMHPIGERAGAKAARAHELPPLAGNGQSTCRMGFFHGTMLGYVSASGQDATKALPALCARDGQGEANCAHIVGHLIAREAPKAHGGVERAIAADCSAAEVATESGGTTEVSPTDERECIRGGYMEVALAAQQPPLADWRRRCDAAPSHGREECYAWLPSLAQYRKLAPRDAAAQCAEVRDGSGRLGDCIEGVSRKLPAGSTCSLFPASVREACTETRSSAA